MIAVSSNTHKILVFAFALDSSRPIWIGNCFHNQGSGGFEGLNEFGEPFKSVLKPAFLRNNGSSDYLRNLPWTLDRRMHHIVIGLIGHEENIPNIAFWNPGCESSKAIIDGTSSKIYLASIDIAGILCVWDVCAARRVYISTCQVMKLYGKLSEPGYPGNAFAHREKVGAAGVWLAWTLILPALYRSAFLCPSHCWRGKSLGCLRAS